MITAVVVSDRHGHALEHDEDAAGPELAYLSKRMDPARKALEARAGKSRLLFIAVRAIMIASAAAVPVLVALPTDYADSLTAGAGVLVLIMLALDWSSNLRGRWVGLESAVQSLQRERFLYLSQAGPYVALAKNAASALLVERVEQILALSADPSGGAQPHWADSEGVLLASAERNLGALDGLASYDGRIRARLCWAPQGESIVGRVICVFDTGSDAVRGDGEAELWQADESVVVHGDYDADPVEFSVKVFPVSPGDRLGAFPRSSRILAPADGVSEEFEFVLVRESGSAGPDDLRSGSLLIDVSQHGRTIQIVEMPLTTP